MVWWILTATAAAGTVAEAKVNLERGEAALESGQRDRARRRLRLACVEAWPEGCALLLETFGEGKEVLDAVDGQCEAGDWDACHRFGLFYARQAAHAHRDIPRALEAYERACRGGVGKSCHYAGWYIAQGRGAEWDPWRARGLHLRGCELDDRNACSSLAYVRMHGIGGTIDPDGALEAASSACDAGHDGACNMLGHWLADGQGGKAQPDAALAAWSSGCSRSHDRSCITAAEHLAQSSVAPADVVEMLDGLCAEGAPAPCAALLTLDAHLTDAQVRKARSVTDALRQACKLDHVASCIVLAERSEPPLDAQLRILATSLATRAGREDQQLELPPPSATLPPPQPVRACLERTLSEILAAGSRRAISPGAVRAAVGIERHLRSLSLQTQRQAVSVPANGTRRSYFEAGDRVYPVTAIPGSPATVFTGPVVTRATPPTVPELEQARERGVVAWFMPTGATPPAAEVLPLPLLLAGPVALETAAAQAELSGVATGIRLGSEHTASNVIGVWPGTGELADEIVVVGAHYDSTHSANSPLAPALGADDNASGVAGVLCAAEATVTGLAAERSRRTLVWVAFTAEELGLLGSAQFLAEPPVPGAMVAMVNLDMIGRMRDDRVWARSTGEGWLALIGDLAAEAEVELHVACNPPGFSDDINFGEAGIPALDFFTGTHGDYHQGTDRPEQLDLAGATAITRTTIALIERLATGAVPTGPVSMPCHLPTGPLGVGIASRHLNQYITRCVPAGSIASALGVIPGDRYVRRSGDPWTAGPASYVYERDGQCVELKLGAAPAPRPCEVQPDLPGDRE